MRENIALITDKKPDTRKCGEGKYVAVYEIHGLTEAEVATFDRFMVAITHHALDDLLGAGK